MPAVTIPLRDFLGLTGDGTGWAMPVTRSLASGIGTLWGGCGLAAAVEAMEAATGRRCAWAAVQYLRPIRPGADLELQVGVGRAGRAVTQAQVTGTQGGDTVLAGLGSLGGSGEVDLQLVSPPEDVPPPEECAPRTMPLPLDFSGTLLSRFEQRWAQAPRTPRTDGRPGTGRTRLWVRMLEPVETSAATLAVIADIAPSAISEALGVTAGGVSLDNTIRLARVGATAPGDWVLLDLTVEAVVADVAQLHGRLFDRTGRLLAVAGQSAVVRRWPT